MLEKLKKRATAALPKVVNGVKALAKKTTKTVVGKFQECKAGKLIGKAVASVPACVGNIRNTISKISAAIPKVKQAAKNEVVKRVNTVQKEVSKAENTVKTNMVKASNSVKASITTVTENVHAGQEKYKQISYEKNQRILEKIKEENKIFAADFVKGTTGVGALLYFSSSALKVPLPGAYYPSLEAINYMIQIRKAIVEEYPSIDWASDVYKEFKQESGSYFNQLGNKTYNKNIPFISDLTGAFTNSSDYQKYGNRTPLDDPRYKIINDAFIMAKPSLIPGVPGAIIKGIRISQNENVASTEGAYDRGFLIEGAGGMVEGIANLVINPCDTVEGIVNIYKEPEKYIPAIVKTANEYVNDKVIHGSPEDRAKLAGRVRFEAMALAVSFIGGGAEAPGVLGKTAEITEMGKAAEAPGVLGKTAEITGMGKAAGVEQKLTEFNEAAKIAKGAETAGELTKGENLIEELLGKMRKLFKGDIGPEEAGQVANKEAGVSIKRVDVGAEEVSDAGKAVGSGGEAIEGAGKGIFNGVDETALKDTVKEHVFSKKHLKSGIADLGVSEDDILNKGFNTLKEMDGKGLIKDGPTQIKTHINGMEAEIKIYIKDGEIISFDMFKGWSVRDMGNTIYY